MLKPIIKEEGVTTTERVLAKLATNTFLGLWSYPNVYRDEGMSKNGIGQEVGDLLVYFEDSLIIFSDKDIAFPVHEDLKVAWARWYRRSIKDSAKQLYGAASFIRNHPSRLFLDKNCTEPFPFDLSSPQLKIHLIAVTCNSYQPAKEYFDSFAKGSSGSLVCTFHFDEHEALEHPFHVHDLDPRKTFVHVLDEFSLDLLLTELDTAADFMHYLETKEHAVRTLNLVSAAGEEEILGFYLQERTVDGYGNIAHPTPQDISSDLIIPEGEWKAFRNSTDYLQLASIRHAGQRWHKLLDLFSESILDANVGEGRDLPILTHERALRCMASENRASRAELTSALFDKYDKVPAHIRSARITFSLCKPSRMYIFLFYPYHKSYADYDEYRHERRACMELYAHVAKYKYPNVPEILVFGADSKGSKGASETIIAYDTSIPFTAEERVQAQQIMVTHNILSTTSPPRKLSSGSASSRAISIGNRYGRNEKCPCGSGEKFKRCCQQ